MIKVSSTSLHVNGFDVLGKLVTDVIRTDTNSVVCQVEMTDDAIYILQDNERLVELRNMGINSVLKWIDMTILNNPLMPMLDKLNKHLLETKQLKAYSELNKILCHPLYLESNPNEDEKQKG